MGVAKEHLRIAHRYEQQCGEGQRERIWQWELGGGVKVGKGEKRGEEVICNSVSNKYKVKLKRNVSAQNGQSILEQEYSQRISDLTSIPTIKLQDIRRERVIPALWKSVLHYFAFIKGLHQNSNGFFHKSKNPLLISSDQQTDVLMQVFLEKRSGVIMQTFRKQGILCFTPIQLLKSFLEKFFRVVGETCGTIQVNCKEQSLAIVAHLWSQLLY